MKWIIILLTTLTIGGQITSRNKTKIDLNAVDRVEIRQKLNDQNTIRLTDQQTGEFVINWNTSQSTGPCKYMPEFWLTVTFKDGTTRTFRANGENVKEDNDWCYVVGNHNFFDRLWTENKKE